MVICLTGMTMTQDWRKRLTWLSEHELQRILESIGIPCSHLDGDGLRRLLTRKIEAEPMLRFKMPNMHLDEN
jgi:hypothetical protein